VIVFVLTWRFRRRHISTIPSQGLLDVSSKTGCPLVPPRLMFQTVAWFPPPPVTALGDRPVRGGFAVPSNTCTGKIFAPLWPPMIVRSRFKLV